MNQLIHISEGKDAEFAGQPGLCYPIAFMKYLGYSFTLWGYTEPGNDVPHLFSTGDAMHMSVEDIRKTLIHNPLCYVLVCDTWDAMETTLGEIGETKLKEFVF